MVVVVVVVVVVVMVVVVIVVVVVVVMVGVVVVAVMVGIVFLVAVIQIVAIQIIFADVGGGRSCDVDQDLERAVLSNGSRSILYLISHDNSSDSLGKKFSQCKVLCLWLYMYVCMY